MTNQMTNLSKSALLSERQFMKELFADTFSLSDSESTQQQIITLGVFNYIQMKLQDVIFTPADSAAHPLTEDNSR